MIDHEEELIIIDNEEAAAFIHDKLLEEGTAISREDIVKILEYEIDYLASMGVIEYAAAVDGDE